MKDIQQIDRNFLVENTIAKTDIRFYDADEEPFRVYGVFRENGKYRRMPEDIAKSVSEGVYQLHSNTAGGRVRFRTDSPYIAIHAEMENIGRMGHFTLAGSAGFDLYADGRHCGTWIPPYEMKNGYEGVLELGSSAMRDIVIDFPLYSDVKALYIGLQKDAAVAEGGRYRNTASVVFYGSSITQGGCASRPGMSYQSIVSRDRNWDYWNLGFSGNAKAEDAMAEYIKSLSMSAFVYDYDHNAPTVEHLRNTHARMFQTIRNAHPNLPILMMPRPKYDWNEEEAERYEIIEETYRNARQSGDERVYLLNGRMLTELCKNEGLVDRNHPTDFGFVSMARALDKVIARYGLAAMIEDSD